VTPEIRNTQQKIGIVMQVVMMLDLNGLLAQIETANAVGAVMEPSMWLASADGIDQWKELAQALREVQRVGTKYGLSVEEM